MTEPAVRGHLENAVPARIFRQPARSLTRTRPFLLSGFHMTRLFIVAAALAALSSAATAQSVPVTLSEWKIELPRDTVHAGSVTFRLKNEGNMVHGFHVTGPGVEKDAPQIAA